MRVLQVNAVVGAGSTGRLVSELNDHLPQFGVTSAAAYSHGSGGVQDLHFGHSMESKFHATASRVTGLQAQWSPIATRRLDHLISEFKPDVVHLHNVHSNNVSLVKLLSGIASRNIATVLTLHDSWFYTGKCTNYVAAGCFRWENECGECPLLGRDTPSWVFDFTVRMLESKRVAFGELSRLGVVGVSDWIAGEARRSFFGDIATIRRIHNWVDTSTFRPRNRPAEGTPQYFLAVAPSWNHQKGLDRLRSFVAELRNRNSSLEMWVVGDAPPGLGPDRVRQLGRVHDVNLMVRLLSQAEAVVSFSRAESFGLTVAESLSCGTPVLVPPGSGAEELVGECGTVVDRPEEPAKWVDSALDLVHRIHQPNVPLRQQARSRALSLFDRDERISDYAEFYHEVVQG
ncbi:glycosyltransferase [Janibacter hoylei]|uniref:glycosyltransferase n=1 Tax=Janibacter hoylei TaxID=364298 RepID=UPI0034D36D09